MSSQPHDASDPAVTLGSGEDCPRCHDPDNNEYHPTQPGQHAIGDICAIHETPTTPVHTATGHTPPYRGPTLATRGLGRPAVILRSARKARRNAQRDRQTECLLCLLATFGHEGDITKLSQILQFFSVPVYPHHMLSECSRLPPHVHTSPEWCEHNAWLFAFAFSSSATISGRWENRDASSRPPSSYRLDEDSLCALVDACQQKRAEWEELILQNPGLAEKWFQEYQEDNARIGKARSMSRASSASTGSRRRSGAGPRAGNMSTPAQAEVPPVPALPEGAAPSASASAGDTTSYSPASSTSEGPIILVPAHGLPSATPRMDPVPSMEDVGTIAGLGNPAQPAEIAPVSAA